MYSGPSSLIPMTLRGLLRLSRDAGLKEGAGIAPEDVKKVTSRKAAAYDTYAPVDRSIAAL